MKHRASVCALGRVAPNLRGTLTMSRRINVNPGHYKVAGRERQGEAIHQSSQKGAYTQQREEARREAADAQAGPPAWETTPPNPEIPDSLEPPARKPRKKTRPVKRMGKQVGKRARKAMPKRKAGRVTGRSRSRSSKKKKK